MARWPAVLALVRRAALSLLWVIERALSVVFDLGAFARSGRSRV